MLKLRWRFVLVLVYCSVQGGIAWSQEIPAHVRECAAESDDARRLDCYDRAVGRNATAESAAAASTLPSPPASPAVAPEPSASDKFGYRGPIAREELDRQAAKGESLERLEATVVELVKQPRGELVVTLDNGQIWAQKGSETVRVRVGDRVVIKSAAFGSFLLVAPNNKSTRVVRQR